MKEKNGISYTDYERLPLFVEKMGGIYKHLFQKYINHADISTIEPKTVYIYCEHYLPPITNKVVVDLDKLGIDGDSIPDIFFDKQWIELTENNLPNAIQIDIIFKGEVYKFGFFFPTLQTFSLTDITHNFKCVQVAKRIFPYLIELFSHYLNAKQLYPSIIFSQKAKGVKQLEGFTPPSVIINLYTDPIPQITLSADYLFVRACPRNPRHGIMESMIIPNTPLAIKTAIKTLFQQAVKLNEPPEVVIQPYIQAEANAVIAPGAMVVAPGNDGVTAGKKKQIILPLPQEFDLYNNLRERSNIRDFEIEAIASSHQVYLTQIRKASGHFQPSQKPKGALAGFTNGKVIPVEKYTPLIVEGLSNIEALERVKPQDQVICFHINGNILSHAAAHCRQNNIPYVVITNKKEIPKSGYMAEVAKGWVKFYESPPAKTEKVEIDWNYHLFLAGLITILEGEIPYTTLRQLWNNIIIFQNYVNGQMTGEWNAYIAGTFAGALLKSTVLICVGELRHAESKCESEQRRKLARVVLDALTGKIMHANDSGGRLGIYQKCSQTKLTFSLIKGIALLSRLAFDTKWESGYGGEKWAIIASTLAQTVQTVVDREKHLSMLNKLLNLCHNNSWAYNKIITEAIMSTPYKVIQGDINIATIEQIMIGYIYGIKTYPQGKNPQKNIIIKEAE